MKTLPAIAPGPVLLRRKFYLALRGTLLLLSVPEPCDRGSLIDERSSWRYGIHDAQALSEEQHEQI
jgi:hypothetical protein